MAEKTSIAARIDQGLNSKPSTLDSRLENVIRLIWYLGKGGVGKTTVAAATALRSAELGYKTLVASTHITPNLADVLDVPLGHEPSQVAENLWAQEISVVTDLQQGGILPRYVAGIISGDGVGKVMSEGPPVFPGLNEVVSLLHIHKQVKERHFERVIIDAAPTGETLRLLTLPDTFRWCAGRLIELGGGVGGLLQSLTGGLVRSPADLVQALAVLDETATALQQTLSDRDISSYRVVVNPEKMAVREAQRAMNYLGLFNYPVDSVILNQVLLESANGGEFLQKQQALQAKYLEVIEAAFRPLPLWPVPYYADEVVGLAALSRLALDCFGDKDPGEVFYRSVLPEVLKQDNQYLLRIPLPFAKGDEIRLRKRGDKLFVTVGNFKREMILPTVLAKRKSGGGRLVKGVLEISFFG